MRSSATATRRGGPTNWGGRGVTAAVSALFVAAAAIYATVQFGRVHGEEFSPQQFRRRRFSYYEIPLLQLQVTPIVRHEWSAKVESYLQRARLLPEKGRGAQRWDLLTVSRGDRILGAGDAQILCDYLDATTGSEVHLWRQWSEEHPEAARLVWPIVARLAERQLYLLIPEVFNLVEQVGATESLRTRLAEQLPRQCRRLADNQRLLGRPDRAAELFEIAESLATLAAASPPPDARSMSRETHDQPGQ